LTADSISTTGTLSSGDLTATSISVGSGSISTTGDVSAGSISANSITIPVVTSDSSCTMANSIAVCTDCYFYKCIAICNGVRWVCPGEEYR